MTIALLPDTAPFSPAQRAWLDGFIAGLFAIDGTAAPSVTVTPAEPEPAEELPWHDPLLSLDERLSLRAAASRRIC
jgi:sulfite reductase (NADPH) flavoprotein alpha-component